MTLLGDILDVDNLNAMVDGGYVRVQTHPTHALRIYNYTSKAVTIPWNEETSTCRGLITDDKGVVRARPFRKFFNDYEHESPSLPNIPWGDDCIITEKVDGSIIIGYVTPDENIGLATRGSFASTQAEQARYIWETKYGYDDFLSMMTGFMLGWTPLWELIDPTNRIVIDYGELSDLVLLGAVHNPTGVAATAARARDIFRWRGPKVQAYDNPDLREDREGKEGYVCFFPAHNLHVKVKHPTYVRLHGLVTRTSTKTIWEALAAGQDVMEYLENVPDELWDWVDIERSKLLADYARQEALAKLAYAEVKNLPTRKEQALLLKKQHPNTMAFVFRMLDGREYESLIWKSIEPEHAAFWSKEQEA